MLNKGLGFDSAPSMTSNLTEQVSVEVEFHFLYCLY